MRIDVTASTIGVLLIWAGVASAFDLDERADVVGLGLMVSGGILLLGALLARPAGRHDGGGLMVAGLVVGLIGLDRYLESQDSDLPIGAVIIIVIGVVILAGALRGRRGPRFTFTSHPHPHDEEPG